MHGDWPKMSCLLHRHTAVQCSPFLRHLQRKLMHRVLPEHAMISKHADGMGLRDIKIGSNLPSQITTLPTHGIY